MRVDLAAVREWSNSTEDAGKTIASTAPGHGGSAADLVSGSSLTQALTELAGAVTEARGAVVTGLQGASSRAQASLAGYQTTEQEHAESYRQVQL